MFLIIFRRKKRNHKKITDFDFRVHSPSVKLLRFQFLTKSVILMKKKQNLNERKVSSNKKFKKKKKDLQVASGYHKSIFFFFNFFVQCSAISDLYVYQRPIISFLNCFLNFFGTGRELDSNQRP